MHPKPKQLLLRGAIPCLAGLLAGQLIPWKTHPPATAARPQPAARGSSDATGTAPGVVAITSESMPPAAQDPPKPESTKERLKKLATNRRVEDLLVEIQKIPPGAERAEGIGLLAKAWFPLDRSGTMKWIGTLTNPEEQKAAYGNMIQYWCSQDIHASSTFVAALPDGELKNSLGVGLSDALSSREPIASLSWAPDPGGQAVGGSGGALPNQSHRIPTDRYPEPAKIK